jgi:hypothetical protein
MASAGLNPRTGVLEASMLTTRPPNPLVCTCDLTLWRVRLIFIPPRLTQEYDIILLQGIADYDETYLGLQVKCAIFLPKL